MSHSCARSRPFRRLVPTDASGAGATTTLRGVGRPLVRHLVVGARLVVGLGLVAQLWLRWIARGNGSTFTGARLGSALLHSDWVGDWGRGVGAVIFLLALLGAGCVAVAPARSSAADWAFLVLGALVVVAGAFVLSSGAPPPGRWGPGLFVVAGAAVLALVAGVAGVLAHRSSIVPLGGGRPT